MVAHFAGMKDSPVDHLPPRLKELAIRMKSDMLEWPDGKTVEKYCVQPGTFCGFVMVFSIKNGEPLAIMPMFVEAGPE